MAFERWDLVKALFPFTDVPVRKPRPVLVLSSGRFNHEHGHIIGCMITTAAGGRWASDIPITDLAKAGLARSSVVRWKMFTLPFDLIGGRIGSLGDEDRGPVAARMTQILCD